MNVLLLFYSYFFGALSPGMLDIENTMGESLLHGDLFKRLGTLIGELASSHKYLGAWDYYLNIGESRNWHYASVLIMSDGFILGISFYRFWLRYLCELARIMLI